MTLQKIWTNHLLCCWLSTVRLIRRVCLLAQNTNTHWTAEETCGSPRLCTDLRKRPHWGGFGHIGNICTLHFHLLTSMLLPPLFFATLCLYGIEHQFWSPELKLKWIFVIQISPQIQILIGKLLKELRILAGSYFLNGHIYIGTRIRVDFRRVVIFV